VLAWIAAIALAAGLSAAFGGEFAADYSVPGSASQRAQDLLAERFPAKAGDTIDVVIRAEEGVDDPAVQAEVAGLLGSWAACRMLPVLRIRTLRRAAWRRMAGPCWPASTWT
jgi:hypothetical protein